jgi:integrase
MEMIYKKYSARVAARRAVSPNVKLGVSRHQMKDPKQKIISSIGTARNHEDALTVFAKWLAQNKKKVLKNFDDNDVAEFMTERALICSQSACDLSRQAINLNLLFENPIPFVASTVETILTHRAYHPKQIEELIAKANKNLALSVNIANSAGLRCMELATISELLDICDISVMNGTQLDTFEDPRNWSPKRFFGRESEESFLVHGKGGLRREVRLARQVAVLLRTRVRDEMKIVKDRRINHSSYFELLCGNNFSQQFSRHSYKVLGHSNGAHGLRHSFAKRRIQELMILGLSFEEAIIILSNELGHFASKNTFVYLRD